MPIQGLLQKANLLQSEGLAFFDFITKHKIFFAKPRQGSCGKGIKKITISLGDNIKELYESLINDNLTILEDVIIQNDKFSLSMWELVTSNIYAYVSIFSMII